MRTEADEEEDGDEELEQPKRAAVLKPVVGAVEDEAVAVADDEDDADGNNNNGGDGVIAAQSKEDKGKAELNGGVSDGEDDDGDGGEIDWQRLFERAQKDVEVVTFMMEEAAIAGVALQVGALHVPDSNLAVADAGKVLLDDMEKLKRCLAYLQGPDDESAVERWASLLKWWRIAERSFSVTGLFAHLRQMRQGKALRERYANLVKKTGDKLLSFKQAEKYDRLGRFLLRFPRFMF